jgi:hypothetical protein
MKSLRWLVVLCLAILAVNTSYGTSYTWTGKAGDHLWATPTNWVPSGPPVSGDTVSINAFQVELDATLSLAGLNIASTTVTGTGALTVTGPSTFSFTTFNIASLTINGPTDIVPGPGADVETAISCPTVNSSTVVVHTGAQFIVNSGANVINNGSWGFDSQSSLALPGGSNTVSFLNKSTLSFTNASLYTVSTYAGSVLSNASGGTIFSVLTNVMNGAVASAGTIQTVSNSVFEIADDARLALFSGANITGPGVTFVNANSTVNGTATVTGGFQLFTDGANTAQGLTINGMLEIAQGGRLYWYAGNLSGVGTNVTGAVQVDQQGILYIINDANGMSLQNVILTNNGSVSWTNSGGLSLGNNAVIANQLNFYINGDGLLRQLLNDTSFPYFTNSGLVIKTLGSTNSAQTAIRVPFYDGGSVHVTQGNLDFYNGGSINNWIVDSNCVINLSSGTYYSQPSANFSATGAINFSGGALINVPPSSTLNISGIFNHNGGVFYGSGKVMVIAGSGFQTVYQWNAGMISITNQSGAFIINSGAYMYIEGGSNFKGLAAGTLVNNYLVFWTNDNSIGGITMSNSAVISNNAGFYLQCDSYLNDGSTSSNAAPLFYNKSGAILAKTAKTGTTTVLVKFTDAGNILADSGTIEFANFSDNYPSAPLPSISLSSGKVQFDNSLVLHANISGTGQITAQKPLTLSSGKMTVTAITLAGIVTNDEVIDMSNFGVLTVPNGPFTQTANGVLIFTLQSTNAGGYSKFAGQSSVILGGGIQATLAYGGAPPVGTSFPVLTCGQLFNTFSNVSVPQGTTVVYTGTGASIVVTNTVPAVLQGYSLNGTNFGFQFATVTNHIYTVEYATNVPPVWYSATNFTAISNTVTFTFPIETKTNTVEIFRVKDSGH